MKRLSKRVVKARTIVELDLLKKLGPRTWLVPGSHGRRYVVYRRKGTTQFECHRDLGGHGMEACPGNSNGTVCYHVMAAIIAAAREKGQWVSFCEKQEDAERLANLGGKVWPIFSAQGKGQLWLVVRGR